MQRKYNFHNWFYTFSYIYFYIYYLSGAWILAVALDFSVPQNYGFWQIVCCRTGPKRSWACHSTWTWNRWCLLSSQSAPLWWLRYHQQQWNPSCFIMFTWLWNCQYTHSTTSSTTITSCQYGPAVNSSHIQCSWGIPPSISGVEGLCTSLLYCPCLL